MSNDQRNILQIGRRYSFNMNAKEEKHRPELPESSTSIWTRRSILLAFWAVVILLGVPHWSYTTSIHRSELPLDAMKAWAGGTVSFPDPQRDSCERTLSPPCRPL